MDCKTTSTRPFPSPPTIHGVTLPELLVALAIGSLLLLAVMALVQYSGRSFAALANYVDMDSDSRRALDVMTKDIRQSDTLTSFISSQIVLKYTNNLPLTFTYDPEARTLQRQFGDEAEILLTGCDYLQFSICQRNPLGGSYDVYPTADPTTCKLIQLDWTCSRSVLEMYPNTETVKSAKIVIRRQ